MLNKLLMEEHVKSALIEDIGYGDITTENLAEDDDKLEKYKISGHEPLSVGLYYRAEEGNEPLRQMAKILKELKDL